MTEYNKAQEEFIRDASVRWETGTDILKKFINDYNDIDPKPDRWDVMISGGNNGQGKVLYADMSKGDAENSIKLFISDNIINGAMNIERYIASSSYVSYTDYAGIKYTRYIQESE